MYYCPICKKQHDVPYGPLILLVALCSRKCNDEWEKLTWNEKQELIDLTD